MSYTGGVLITYKRNAIREGYYGFIESTPDSVINFQLINIITPLLFRSTEIYCLEQMLPFPSSLEFN